MPHTLRNLDGVKLLFSCTFLGYLIFLYMDFLCDLGDLYPDMILDEVVSSLLGLGLVLLWYRRTKKWLRR